MSEEQEKVLDLLMSDETALETAKEHFEVDEESSDAFGPKLKIKASSVLYEPTGRTKFINFFNERSKRSRARKFNRKLDANPESFVIVSEGDSWFQYPIFLKDIIDHLNEYPDYAIRSFGYGADWLSNMVDQAEFINDIRYYEAKIFMLSGGGNDLLAGGKIKDILHPFSDSISDADGYFKQDKKKEVIDHIHGLYTQMFARLNRLFPDLHILCHGYDYAIPKEHSLIGDNKHRWLWEPMTELAIPEGFRSEIVVILMDSFYEMLEKLKSEHKNIHIVDNRNEVAPNEWNDELHPKNYGFMKIAQNFHNVIEKIRQDL
ncbi:MAG: hypothetical protein JXQ90_03730 [Cyclobacteriaceae bacterium]